MNEIEKDALVETIRHLLPKPIREDDELPGEVVLIGEFLKLVLTKQ